MTDMYRVRVEAVEGNRLTCRVAVVYSGETLVPSRTLAFRFVWEPWYDLCDGMTRHLPGGGKGVTPEEAREMGRVAPLNKELANRDMDDSDWNQANADRFVCCVGITDRRNHDKADSEANEQVDPPHATYTITVTDPAWLAHLAPGMEWDTTGFDDDVWPRVHQWLTPDIMALAQGIDKELAFERLPILADALQEAGCDCDDILNHFRDVTATHVRGCWALDVVLGRE